MDVIWDRVYILPKQTNDNSKATTWAKIQTKHLFVIQKTHQHIILKKVVEKLQEKCVEYGILR